MKIGQTSKRAGIQDILCPFDKLYITQGSGFADGNFSHKGTRAVDVSNGDGERAPYYAPFDCKVTSIIPDYGEAIWQSLEPVRFADGTIDYCSFTTCHDDSINYGVGYVAHQGEQIGNMGAKGPGVTGVHCHIEFAKGLQGLYQNEYGIWGMVNSCEIEEACFMNDTEILLGIADWKYLEDVPVEEPVKEEPTPIEPLFEVGDIVIPINLVDYQGTELIQYDETYEILEIDERGAVLGAVRGDERPIWAVLSLDNIKKRA